MRELRYSEELIKCAKATSAESLLIPGLESHIHLENFESGESVIDAGEPISYLYILVKGVMKIYSIREDGKTSTVAYAYPPQMIGDIEYIQNYNSLHFVSAETPITMIRIDIEVVRKYLSNSIEFYRFICRNLIQKLYRTSDDYAKSLLYSSKKRFAQFLCESVAGSNGLINFSSSSLAQTLGITTRHMSRLVTEFVNQGVLMRQKPKRLKILDYPYLSKLTE